MRWPSLPDSALHRRLHPHGNELQPQTANRKPLQLQLQLQLQGRTIQRMWRMLRIASVR
jgi:hypothetical protein